MSDSESKNRDSIPDGSSTPLNIDYWGGDVEISAKDIDDIKLADALATAIVPPTTGAGGESNAEKISPPVYTEEKPSKKRDLCKDGGPSAPTVSRRKKKPKGMPKRPLSAYNVFFQSERVKVLDEHSAALGGASPSVSFEELGRTIGSRWKMLSEEEKKKYELLAQQDSVRYRTEMEVFNETKRRRTEEKNKAAEISEKPPASAAKVLSSPPDIKPPFFFPLQAKLPGQYGPSQSNEQKEWQRQQEDQQQQGFGGTARESACSEANFPIPPGTEVWIGEHNFKVQYKFYTMTRSAAETYMENLHKMQFGFNEQQKPPQPPQQQPPPPQQQQQLPLPPSQGARDYQHFWG